MSDTAIPKGASRETLEEVVVGWADAGADEEPVYTADVAEGTGLGDVVRRQTRFLEDLGVLEPDGQRRRLTDEGTALAEALAAVDEEAATNRWGNLLETWPFADEVRGVLRENPTDREALVPVVAALAGADLDARRQRTGVETLLDLCERSVVLAREDDRYRPAEPAPAASGAEAEPAEAGAAEAEAAAGEAVEGTPAAEGVPIAEAAASAGEAAEPVPDEEVTSAGEAVETVAGTDAEAVGPAGLSPAETGELLGRALAEVAAESDPEELAATVETLLGAGGGTADGAAEAGAESAGGGEPSGGDAASVGDEAADAPGDAAGESPEAAEPEEPEEPAETEGPEEPAETEGPSEADEAAEAEETAEANGATEAGDAAETGAAAEAASESMSGAPPAGDGAGPGAAATAMPGPDTLGVSLDLTLDADPEQVSGLVEGVRRGLSEAG
ncbi:MAG: hypothetical protein ABEJ42_04135 [Halobacteriaceae archaeon]